MIEELTRNERLWIADILDAEIGYEAKEAAENDDQDGQ